MKLRRLLGRRRGYLGLLLRRGRRRNSFLLLIRLSRRLRCIGVADHMRHYRRRRSPGVVPRRIDILLRPSRTGRHHYHQAEQRHQYQNVAAIRTL